LNNLELIDTLIKEKKTSIDVHKSILESDNSRRWFHNKMIKECEEHIEILFKIKSELEEYQKLKEKETPMKPPLTWEYAKPKTRCKCSAGVEKYHSYCWNCGQKLYWNDEND
jgi:hypothetical protein